jgi:hypothetical protein
VDVRGLYYDDQDLEAALSGASPSIFLAGPTARGVMRTPWRQAALERLAGLEFPGAVVVPEFRAGTFDDLRARVFGGGESPVPHLAPISHAILDWETRGIEGVTAVLFWMPFCLAGEADPASLPGFTTRAEVSRELARDPGRIVLGMPPGALSGGHIRFHAARAGVPVLETLEATVEAAVRLATRR